MAYGEKGARQGRLPTSFSAAAQEVITALIRHFPVYDITTTLQVGSHDITFSARHSFLLMIAHCITKTACCWLRFAADISRHRLTTSAGNAKAGQASAVRQGKVRGPPARLPLLQGNISIITMYHDTPGHVSAAVAATRRCCWAAIFSRPRQ